MIYTVSVIMTEKVQGLLTRNFAAGEWGRSGHKSRVRPVLTLDPCIAGMRYSEVAVAHTLVQTAIMVVQNISVLFVFFQIFKYSLVNHAGYILIVQVLCNIFGVTLGSSYSTTRYYYSWLKESPFCHSFCKVLLSSIVLTFFGSGTKQIFRKKQSNCIIVEHRTECWTISFVIGFATIELFNNELFATYFCVGATVIVFHVSGK